MIDVLSILMAWQLWAAVHGVLAIIAIVVAVRKRCWWTAALSGIGAVCGAVLAVAPWWFLMQRAEAQTGFDPGNAGIFFCCSVPLVPLIGLIVGASLGYIIDCRGSAT